MGKRDDKSIRSAGRPGYNPKLHSEQDEEKENGPKKLIERKRMGIEELVLRKVSEREMTLHDLVDDLSNELGYERDRITQKFMGLHADRRITVTEGKPHVSLLSYTFSPLSLWFWAAAAATLLSLVLVSVTSGPVIYLRYIFGGSFVFFLPGYSLVEFLYAKRKELDDLTRIALSIGLSIALVSLTGVALDYTPFGIHLISVAVSLAVLTLILLVLAARRKYAYYKLAKNV